MKFPMVASARAAEREMSSIDLQNLFLQHSRRRLLMHIDIVVIDGLAVLIVRILSILHFSRIVL